MTPGARIQAAIEIMQEIEAAPMAAEAVISIYFRKRRYAGSKDRRAVRDHVFDVLRRRARLDWRIENHGLEAGARQRLITFLGLAGGQEKKTIAALFSGEGHAPPPLSETELTLAALTPPLETEDMPPWMALEYPDWLDGELRKSLGGAFEAEMKALNVPAPVDVRVNTLKGSRDEVARALADEGICTQVAPLSPIGLRLDGRPSLNGTRAFREGLVEVQDTASQIAALLVGAKPGMAVADYCAGGGGKTLALSAAMENRGELAACDVSKKRMADLDKRLARAGVKNVRSFILDEDGGPWLAENRGRFERVLVDAPCSGSGAWRRDVTARWRLTAAELKDLTQRQARILDAACGLVAAQGRLIYATCSLLACENEDQIQRFLKDHLAFAAVPIETAWDETIGGPCPAEGPFLRLSPAATDTDGFFVAVLEKR